MNIAAQVGPSFKRFETSVWGHDITDGWLNNFWAIYEMSGDGLWERETFEDLTRKGHLLHVLMYDGSHDFVAGWSLELLRDHHGFYLSFLDFLKYDGVRLKAIAPAIVAVCFRMVQVMQEHGMQEKGAGRMRLRGRDGWQRLLPRYGIEITADGWIYEDQEVFRNGLQFTIE